MCHRLRFPTGGVPYRGSTPRETQPLALLPRPVAAEAVQANKEVIVLRLRRPRPSHGSEHRSPTRRTSRILQGPNCAGEGHQSPCKGLAAQQAQCSHPEFPKLVFFHCCIWSSWHLSPQCFYIEMKMKEMDLHSKGATVLTLLPGAGCSVGPGDGGGGGHSRGVCQQVSAIREQSQ